MRIEQLVSAVNAARAIEDHVYFHSVGRALGKQPSPQISFNFDGEVFQTEIPYRIRLTKGVVLDELNRGCYLIRGNESKKVTFVTDSSENVVWLF